MPRHLTTNDTPSFITATQIGAADGVAALDADGKVPSDQLPDSITTGVLSVNGKYGNVVLAAPDVAAVPASSVGVANGVAPLDGTARIPSANAPRSMVQVFNVKDYQAQGNDSADDSSAIQAAASAASAVGGGTVYFPAGTYKISTALAQPNNVSFVGAGDTVSIIHQTSTTQSALSGNDIQNVVISDLGLTGPGSGSGHGVSFGLVNNGATLYVTMRNVTVKNFGGDGVNIKIPIVSSFDRVVAQSCGGYGFNLYGVTTGAGSPGTSCSLRACYGNGCGAGGYRLYKLSYVELSSCAADNNPVGYLVDQGWGVALTGCGSEGNTTGLKINGGYAVSARSIFVYNNVGTGIWVTGAAHTVGLYQVTDVTPGTGAANFIKVDAGSFATILGMSNTSPNALTGTVNIFDDGGNGTVTSGYAYFGNTLEASTLVVDGTATLSADPTTAFQAATKQYVDARAAAVLGWLNVKDYGAKADGTTDDTAKIQAALNACAPGGIVYAPGPHATSAPLIIPPQVTLLGSHGAHIDIMTSPTIKPLASFSGAAVILLVDQATGGYAGVSYEQRIEKVSIDCSNLTGTVIDGIQAQGYVHGVYLTDVQIRSAPAHGIATVSNTSGSAYSWRGTRVRATGAGGIAFSLSMTDSTWTDCESIAAGSHGWFIGGAANSVFMGCRSEWSGLDGFNLGGSTGTGQGSGGPTFIGCTTDRNRHSGFGIISAGNAPINISGCTLRRDGSASSSSGYSGVNVNGATAPVVISGLTVYPGLNDDSTGINSPQYGLSITGATLVQADNLYLHAATQAYFNGGSNGSISLGNSINFATGTTAAPVRTQPMLDMGGLSSPTAFQTVSNTITETVVSTLTIPANDAAAGSVYRMKSIMLAAVTGTPTFTLRLRLGGLAGPILLTLGPSTAASGVVDRAVVAEAEFIVLSAGATGTCMSEFRQVRTLTTAGQIAEVQEVLPNATAAINTTISNDLVITWQWGTASASNTVTRQAVIAGRFA